MGEVDPLTQRLLPWMQAAEALARWCTAGGAPENQDLVALPGELLQALARRETAIPAEVTLPASVLESWPGRIQPAAALRAWRQRREALLRLAVWRVLWVLSAAGEKKSTSDDTLGTLQIALGARDAGPVPPGLAPTLTYAASAKARGFFEGALRTALARLAEQHDGGGAGFAHWASQLAPGAATSVAAAQGWSQAWSVAVAAVYLDWLGQAALGRLQDALRLVWSQQAVRFRAPAGLVVLPARERSMHVDLWTDLVLAQALAHDAARFDDPRPWHCVTVAMHDLGGRERAGKGDGTSRHIHRGLGVEMLYQTVFAGRATLALAPQEDGWSPPLPPPEPAIVLEVPRPSPGQQANYRLVLRWKEDDEDGGTVRFDSDASAPPLDPHQLAVLRRWAVGEVARGGARRLSLAEVDWHTAREPEDGAERDEQLLGDAALWQAAATLGPTPEWIDVMLVVHHRGRWQQMPLALADLAPRADGEAADAKDGTSPRCALRLRASDDTAVDPRRIRRALDSERCQCWAGRAAGLGAFLMVGVDLDREARPDG